MRWCGSFEKLDAGEIVNKAPPRNDRFMKREQARYANRGRTIWDVPMASKYGAR